MAPQDGPQDSPLADPSPMPPTGFAPDPNPSDPAEPGQGKTGRLPPPPTLTEDDVAELGLPKNALNILAHRTKANRAVETGQSPMGPTDTPLRLGEEARLAPGQENPPERQSPLRLTPSESAPVTAAGLELPQPLSPSDDGLSQSPKTDPQGIVARDEAPKWTSPSHRPEPPLLYLDNIYTDIGRYKILRGVNLSIPKGSVTMLLGRNGAGKTTTLRTIMGLWQARDGAIRFNGDEITGMKTPEIARAGIGYVPEDMGIFGDLTVEQNMILAARKGRIPKDHLDWLFGRF
ncbi:MAG: ATP-binding cassette domain-containing protein, partial [Mangrovicoccus sp.]